MCDYDLLKKHISTHSKRSAEDRAAVKTLETFLSSDGKINTDFSCDDKWPNHDGAFEFVSNPEVSRIPEQNFIVQIKGTHYYRENDGIISYSLTSLAFPAYIASEVTADPGILFVVLNPDVRGEKRVFWKYISPRFIQRIDFNKDSITIKFNPEDEIKDTDESVNKFCSKLQHIIDIHLFLNKLNKENLRKEDALKITEFRCKDISLEIDRISSENITRDYISRRMINGLYDICYAVLVLNAMKQGYTIVNERLAWELAQMDIETKYLSNFLKGLKYIGSRIPDEGQSERLMLKYYGYLWEIRKFLSENFDIKVLDNLEAFPLDTDTLDTEYYNMVASCFDRTELFSKTPNSLRYYIQKKTPFFVNGERYYEVTLQLAGLYATKFNRITVYTKQNISTNYSIQIAYTDAEIELWGMKSSIKIVTNWIVSIDPSCLNKLAKMLRINTKLSKTYGEYNSLMEFLTRTGMNLFDLINLSEKHFKNVLFQIYDSVNTSVFKNILMKLRQEYSLYSTKKGKYTVRYILMNLHEEVLEAVLPTMYDRYFLTDELYISSRCYPFEQNPFISNLAGRKTSKGSIKDILEITNELGKYDIVRPYIEIEKMIRETGEVYFDIDSVASREEIKKYNDSLDRWERGSGFGINEENGVISIDSYEKNTLFILEKLLMLSQIANKGQRELNLQYLRNCSIEFEDIQKKVALQKAFVNSRVMLVYGAAGTGKTTLINYISNMLNQSKKLFLTKTYTALQNLKRKIDNPGINAEFVSIDSFTKSITLADYDIVFVDECSTIDNRTMKKLLEKIDEKTFLVLAGDIYQIESIEFGNWFYYAKEIVNSNGSSVELFNTWRTDRKELKSLWDAVRKVEPIISEKLALDGPFSADIGEDLFQYEEGADEIVLCLNYDGKFGLNNMNLYFQNANMKSEIYTWAEWSFKIGDPVIFLDTKRSSLLYNNLKGRIVDIFKNEMMISFTLDIDTILTERQCRNESFEFIDVIGDKTRIRLDVFSSDDESVSDGEQSKTIIPFQIAYAVSIHKAQGLEYKSVKIVIPSCNAEKISHAIFYTAVTRAKEKLKIYWSAETMESIIGSFDKEKDEQRTLSIIKRKLEVE